MSAYRDSLPATSRGKYDTAVTTAGEMLARICLDTDILAAEHGTRAVAEAAWSPGKSLDAIEASYTALQQAARQKQAAA
jgi:hypothetical protein